MGFFANKWLKYGRYDKKTQSINQSIMGLCAVFLGTRSNIIKGAGQ